MAYVTNLVVCMTALHFIASFWPGVRWKSLDLENVRQHHEQCVMLGLIALAILNWRN